MFRFKIEKGANFKKKSSPEAQEGTITAGSGWSGRDEAEDYRMKMVRRRHPAPLKWTYSSRLALIATLATLLATVTGVGGLKSVWLKVPVAVAPGQSATLLCGYDLEGEPLYTVKWYKGRQEFFRYLPKEHPPTKVFPMDGVNVDIDASGPDKVVLRDVQMDMAGKYRCEVSSDAPNFHTQVVSAHMHVVHMLEGEPKLRLEKTRYSVGDTLRGNCTSPPSIPPANLTWLINGNKINASYISRTPVGQSKSVTTAGLELEVNTFTFGKMKVTCIADVYKVYTTQAEVVLDEERPRLASVLGGGAGSSSVVSVALLVACGSAALYSR